MSRDEVVAEDLCAKGASIAIPEPLPHVTTSERFCPLLDFMCGH